MTHKKKSSKNPPLQASTLDPDLTASRTLTSYQHDDDGSSSFQKHQQQLFLLPPSNGARQTPLTIPANNNNDSDFGDNDDMDDFFDAAKHHLLSQTVHMTLAHDPDRGYRGTQLLFWNWNRPHMRAFHASWMCQFACSFCQFSQAPLLATIQHSLHLTKSDIWWTNLWMMMGGIPMRFLLGALCDAQGARTTMALVVAGAAIPCLLTGFVATNLTRLTMMRTLLGAMDAFVPGQYWITCMFVRDVAGTAMAITGGLGASGSGVTQLVVGSGIFPLLLHLTHDKDLAWKWALTVPAAFCLLVSWYFYHYSDDCPLGQVAEVKKAGLMMQRSAVASFRSGVYNFNSWILFFQFAGSCGVDLTMCNGVSLYFYYQLHQSIAASGAFAFLYGISAVFARALGGWMSDQLGDKYSLRGRLYAQMVCMLLQGLLNVWFARTHTLGKSLYIMIAFSILVQMSMGTCFGIVSYVDGPNTGSVAGIVGAGGNAGASLLAVFFMTMEYGDAMELMGWWTMAMALLTPLIVVKGYRGILFGDEAPADSIHRKQQSPLMVPGKLHHSPHLVSLRAKHLGKR